MIVYMSSQVLCGRNADVAQSVVRRIGSAEVTGPIPVISSIKKARNYAGNGVDPSFFDVFSLLELEMFPVYKERPAPPALSLRIRFIIMYYFLP